MLWRAASRYPPFDGVGGWAASPLSGHLRTPGDLLSIAAFPAGIGVARSARCFCPTRGNSMAKSLKLGEILGGGGDV